MTQSELASDLISVTYLSLIESGKREASIPLLQAIDARLSARETDGGISTEVQDLISKARAALQFGQPQIAKSFISQISITSNSPKALQNTITNLDGYIDLGLGNFHLAQKAFRQVLESETDLGEEMLRAVIGICRCSIDLGGLEEAISFIESTMRLLAGSRFADHELHYELRATASSVFLEFGDLHKALTLTQLSEQEVHDATPWHVATASWSHAILLERQGDTTQATTLANRALTIMSALDKPLSIAKLQATTAWITLQSDHADLTQVDALLTASETYFAAHDLTNDLGIVLTTRAEYFAQSNSYDESIECYNKSLQCISPTAHSQIAWTHSSLAATHTRFGHIEEALDSLAQATQELSHTGSTRIEARTWHHMALTYEALNKYDLAYECMKIATGMLGFKSPTQDPSVLLK